MKLPTTPREEAAYKKQVWKDNPAAIRIRFNRQGSRIIGYEILNTTEKPARSKVKPNYVKREKLQAGGVGGESRSDHQPRHETESDAVPNAVESSLGVARGHSD